MIEKLYTVEEVAELASVTGRTIRNYLKSGRLLGRKIGGQWRFPESEVQRLLTGGPLPEDSDAADKTDTAAEGTSAAREDDADIYDAYTDAAPHDYEEEPPAVADRREAREATSVSFSDAQKPAPTATRTDYVGPAPLPSLSAPTMQARPAYGTPSAAGAADQKAAVPAPDAGFSVAPSAPSSAPYPAGPVAHEQPVISSSLGMGIPAEQPGQPAPFAAGYAPPSYTPAPQQQPSYAAAQQFASQQNSSFGAPPVYPAAGAAPAPGSMPGAEPPAPPPSYSYPQQAATPQPPYGAGATGYYTESHPEAAPGVPSGAAGAPPHQTSVSSGAPSDENSLAAELSDVGKRVARFVTEVHDCSSGPQVCTVIDVHQAFSNAKVASERLAQVAGEESESGTLCQVFVEYDERYFVARYTLFGSSPFVLRCLKLLG